MHARFRALRSRVRRQVATAVVRHNSIAIYESGNSKIQQNVSNEASLVPTSDVDEIDECFRYTSGRWLYNEALRLNERNLLFNIPGLLQLAAKAVNGTTKDVAAFGKLAEGGFNRTFLITMKDGLEIVARLPYPVAFPSQLTVASEVATLGLVKSHGVPVPNVLDYSTTSENPIGVEYILMEKAQGEELGDRWFSLPDLDRAKIIGRLSQIEEKLSSIPLPASGSIFYRKDLDASLPVIDILGNKFCVGPSVGQRWWHDRRDRLQIFRGPFLTAEQYLRAGAEKELSWVDAYGQPRFPARGYRELTKDKKSEPLEHVESLRIYLQAISHIMPTAAEHQYLLRPTIRHPDLNPRNIFIDKDLQNF
ncbi:MAG: hypothetical protein M1820_003726 [Bogoriella megaspora]|nr:MAG: hypothetical protein M1820_003726 [Bogoriella megaspora]